MEITIKPRKLTCQNRWSEKKQGVVLVQSAEDIDVLFDLLMKQDDYWENYKHLIKVAPKEIDDERDIEKMCEYTGKTGIYNIPKLKKQVNFVLFQYEKTCMD